MGGRGCDDDNVIWHRPDLDRGSRWEALGARGATVWLTGLPSSGKSTIAAALEHALVCGGRAAYMLDGDNLRHGLNGNLGFSDEDRSENVRRTAEVARLLADCGVIAVVSLVSPFAAGRAGARLRHEEDGLDFIEVFVDSPVEECERRDPKGLYAKARRGELTGFTGVDAPYEVPENPELVVETARTDLPDAVRSISALIDARALQRYGTAGSPSPNVS